MLAVGAGVGNDCTGVGFETTGAGLGVDEISFSDGEAWDCGTNGAAGTGAGARAAGAGAGAGDAVGLVDVA